MGLTLLLLLLFIYLLRHESSKTQTYKHTKTYKNVKPYAIKLQWDYKYAATDPANACVTVPFILSLDAVDRTPYLLHIMKAEIGWCWSVPYS